jgi:hypothetical protein
MGHTLDIILSVGENKVEENLYSYQHVQVYCLVIGVRNALITARDIWGPRPRQKPVCLAYIAS